MKKIFTYLCTAIAIAGPFIVWGCTSVADPNSFYQYPFKAVKIEYAITGTSEGKSILMIKGDKLVRENHIVLHGPGGDEEQNNMHIEVGRDIYDINLDKKNATKTLNPFYELFVKTSAEERQDLLKKIAAGASPDNVTAKKEIQSIGSETVAGQNCEIYSTPFGAGKICLWNAIPLKTTLFKTSNVATSVQIDPDIPDSSFEIPAGITLKP